MRWLHGGFARFFNDRHKRCGHLFQGRFGSVRIEDDAQLWMTIAYIARNPVASGLCDTVGDWPWSSHRDVAGPPDEPDAPGGGRTDVGRLLELLTAFGGDPRRRYDELVEPVAVAA